ncbi:MAG: hypothetical protein Q7R67_02005, partial [bacterium]|nr:hypothetical protein [bacterium]
SPEAIAGEASTSEPSDMPPEAPQASAPVVEPTPVIVDSGAPSVLKPLNRESAKQLSVKAHLAVTARIRGRLEKVMKLVSLKGKIANRDVQLLLHVSAATAARYLGQLEREGRIARVGKGNATRYRQL